MMHERRSPSGVERVLCAAIYVDDGKPAKRQDDGPKTGRLFCGFRHWECYIELNHWVARLSEAEEAALDPMDLQGRNQGFLTSTGRFVDRQEAAKVAFAAGQIDRVTSGLISEDLY